MDGVFNLTLVKELGLTQYYLKKTKSIFKCRFN